MINRKTNIIHVFPRHVLPAIEKLSEGRAREINTRTLVRFRALFQAGKCSSVRAFISRARPSLNFSMAGNTCLGNSWIMFVFLLIIPRSSYFAEYETSDSG